MPTGSLFNMIIRCLCITILITGLTVSFGDTTTDVSRCASRGSSDSSVVKLQFCVVTKRDVKLSCPKEKIVVLSALQLAMKTSRNSCMKRIVDRENEFCCFLQDDDVFYDGYCLQDFWNKEDKVHFQNFTERALRKCKDTYQCVLNAEMFSNIQKEIPRSHVYSSYFQVAYQCVIAPTKPLQLCLNKSSKGTLIDIRNGFATSTNTKNNNCTCRVSSQGGGNVIIKAVDVRTAKSELTVNSGRISKNLSQGHLPLFGFKKIFSGNSVTISLRFHSPKLDDNIWLQVSGSNGKYVNVTCGESSSFMENSSTLPDLVLFETQTRVRRVLGGYWPLIYVGAGSLFTIIVVSCILAVILIYDRRKRKKRRRRQCGYPCMQLSGSHHPTAYDMPYATVQDEAVHTPDHRMAQSTASNGSDACNQTSTSMRCLRPPSAPPPPPPPPNVPGKNGDASSGSGSYYQFNLTPGGASCDVSELEAFLECKDASNNERSPNRRLNPAIDPVFGTMSHQRVVSRFVYD